MNHARTSTPKRRQLRKGILKNESVRKLIDTVKEESIVDYFDIPKWIESLAEGCTLMEMLHQSATSTDFDSSLHPV